MSLSPHRKKPKIDWPEADARDDAALDRSISTKHQIQMLARGADGQVNPVFGPGFPNKFDKFRLLPRLVREAVYSCVDFDTSRSLAAVLPEVNEYYERRPFMMEVVTLTYTPDCSYSPFTDYSDFAIQYRSGSDPSKRGHSAEVHTLGLQYFDWMPGFRSRFNPVLAQMPAGIDVKVVKSDQLLLHIHKRSYVPKYIYRNLRYVCAAVIRVHALSFLADTPSGLEPVRRRSAIVCFVFEDADLDLVDKVVHMLVPGSLRYVGGPLNVNMGDRPDLVVSGIRDWMRYIQPEFGLEIFIGYVMTVPAGVFNLHEVRSAEDILIQRVSNPTTDLFEGTKIDITISQLRALRANCISLLFEMPSISLDELLLFVMDKIKAWLAEPDPSRRYYFMFYTPTVDESKELMFVDELNSLVMGDHRFKLHSIDIGVWIRGTLVSAPRSSILEDTKFDRHILVSCGAENTVSLYPLYACGGYEDCQCVIGLGPCKTAE